MHQEHERYHHDWCIPDEWWEPIVPLLPPRKPHPLGCHCPRADDRKAMNAIFFVLRTGCQWNALNETGICSSSAGHRGFQEWTAADVFLTLWFVWAPPSVAPLPTNRLEGRMKLNTPHIPNADPHQNARGATTERPLTLQLML
jgi:transposase